MPDTPGRAVAIHEPATEAAAVLSSKPDIASSPLCIGKGPIADMISAAGLLCLTDEEV